MSLWTRLIGKIKAWVERWIRQQVGATTTADDGPRDLPSSGPPLPTAGTSAASLPPLLAGPIPAPTDIPLDARGAEGEFLAEEKAVPLAGTVPHPALPSAGIAGQLQASWGFLWKPIAGGTGRVVLYLPAPFRGQLVDYESWAHAPASLGKAVIVADVAGKKVDERLTFRAIADDDRIIVDCSKRREEFPRRCWVVCRFKDGTRLYYPIVDAMLRNGAGHGGAPPYLYPILLGQSSTTQSTAAPSGSPTPVSAPVPTLASAPAVPFRAIMPTDWGVTRELVRAYGAHWGVWQRAGIDTVHVVADLPREDARPHIGPGRTRTGPTDLLLGNLATLRRAGFRVILTAANEPSVRRGMGARMGVGATSLADCYTPARLQDEKAFWKGLLARFVPDALMLCLEPSHTTAVPFQRELAAWLRERYAGPIYGNGFGEGAWYGPESGVRDARSLSWAGWGSGPRGVLVNCDGMDLAAANVPDRVPRITGAPGQDGWILWYCEYRGQGGPSQLADWMWRHIAKG